ncbi:tripartite tricarboxylate transporter substrate binding protein [Cupriavidus oxalaticus]|uniref:Bug family tripartite tricarboxylate transporter substrate binding protein n=1 Tax=Cupriavidus oxalaticus TaxID=96344 RepID=UPI00317F4A6E
MTTLIPQFRTLLARTAAAGRGFLLACGTLAAAAPAALAVPVYPAKPVTLVVPGPPGGITDQIGRLVAARMTSDYGVRVVVDNRPGAGGNLATDIVARAEPDGYTVLLGTQGTMASNQFLYKALRFDPAKDFVAAQGLVSIPNLLVVNGKLPYQSVKDLVAYAKAHPGKLAVSSAGNGTGSHLAAELFQTLAGVKFVHVPYKGSAPSITDLLAGQVDLTFDYPVSTLAQVQAGKLRALAVTGASRLPALPQVPTIAEAGYPGAESTSWIGLFFPARTPAAVVAKWEADVGRMLKEPATVEAVQKMGGVPLPLSGEAFRAFVQGERTKWKATIERAGATLD